MKILYYDCFAGISGDMNLSTLIDAGLDPVALEVQLRKLNLDGWSLKISKDSKNGIFGTRLDVICEHSHEHHHHHHEHEHCEHHHHEHRKFSDIATLINNSTLSENVKKKSLAIFQKIAEAEAKIHGKDITDVNFHEVGAVDSIIDIVGCAIAFELLGIDKAVSTAVELGGGTVKCAHGVLTVPAPATSLIAKDFPSKLGGAMHECTTPTGAAIIATMCSDFSPKINGKIIASGIGIGHRDSHELTNILRVSIIETQDEIFSEIKSEKMFELSANIDDMTAEHLAELCQNFLTLVHSTFGKKVL
ncbi:MAG: LarC family nickel insertion protein [Opitutales bacterium]|nr:LarC family nickel insertion protein [Opitutales bacterium]